MVEEREEPKLRFPGFADPWEQRKFGDVLETVTDYVAAGSFADLAKNVEYRDKPDFAQLVRTMDLKNGFTSSQEVFVDENAFHYLYRVNLDKECIILPNIGNCGEVYFVRPEALPYQHNVLGPNAIYVRSETNNNLFLSTLFQAKDFQTKLSLIVSPNGQTKFNKTELKQIELVLPSSETEQNKIGGFFEMVDEVIILHQRKRDEVKALKNAMLQKMFPKDGETVPEIRFPGFTDPWEQRKLSDVAEVVGGGTPSTTNPEYWDGDINWYAPAEIGEQIYVDSSERKITKLGLEKSSAKILPAHKTVLFTSRAGIGNTAILRTPAATNQGFQSMVLHDDINPYFVFSMTGMIKAKAERVASGSTFAEISGKMLGNLEFMFPLKAEQDKIGDYFESLDNLITLHQRKCDELKELKKGLLQQMFV